MFFKITSYIKGYVSIAINGLFPERFINLCTNNKISLWNIKRKNKREINANIYVNDFKKIRKTTRNSGCRIHIFKKHGLRFLIYKYRKRKVLAIGFIVFFAVLWGLTKFVWIIEITGNEKIPDNVILECAKKGGLKTGMLVSSVRSGEIQSFLATSMEDLSFVSVNRAGTTVYIDVREREKKREREKTIP